MLSERMRSYISNLPIGAYRAAAPQPGVVTAVDIDNLPDGIVTGSNLIQFPGNASPEIKSSVALSLLAAQRVASNDTAITTPQQWIARHNTILANLNWLVRAGGTVESEFKNINVAVHEAVIPFLTAAFGPVVAAGALILTALKQLQEMDKNSPWITLFDQESRHFDVTEYQFSVVQIAGDQVTLKLASARFNASFGRTEILFFKVTRQTAKFESASSDLSATSSLLIDMNDGLKTKLAGFTSDYIRSLPIGLSQAAQIRAEEQLHRVA
jgi:hypothetical protein